MLDFQFINQYLEGDAEIIQMVLQTYYEDHASSADKLVQYHEAQDWKALQTEAHTLKGILASFGEEIAVPALERIENNSMQQTASSQDDLDLAIAQIAVINKQVKSYLEGETSI